jgi:hypothetical protein
MPVAIVQATPEQDQQLISAVKAGDTAKVRVLINEGANVLAKNSMGTNALMYAAKYGYTEIAKLLLNKYPAYDTSDIPYVRAIDLKDHGFEMTALVYAAANGHADIVKLLVDKGADVNAGDLADQTALIWAAKGGYVDVVKTLLQAGANVNIRDEHGSTALKYAEHNGHNEVVKLLKAAGAKS